MDDSKLFELRIITPERVFYEGQVTMVEFNTTEGEMGIYKGHIPTTVIIDPGVLTITEPEQLKNAALLSGFAQILPDEVTILAEIVEWPSEIDEERAEERLAQKGDSLDVARATIALKKAICRLETLK